LLFFVKRIGAESQEWRIEKLPVLGLILEYLPAQVALEIVDLFFQDQLNFVLTPRRYSNLSDLTNVLQEWIVIFEKLTDDWTPTTVDFLKRSVWIFRRNVARSIIEAYPLVDKNVMQERVQSVAQEFLPSQCPLLVLLNENMDVNGIDQWLFSFKK